MTSSTVTSSCLTPSQRPQALTDGALVNSANNNSGKRSNPSWAGSILEATWSESVLAAGPARLGISYGGFREAVWRPRRCQAGLGVGSQEVATQVRLQPVMEEEQGCRCSTAARQHCGRDLGRAAASEHWCPVYKMEIMMVPISWGVVRLGGDICVEVTGLAWRKWSIKGSCGSRVL